MRRRSAEPVGLLPTNVSAPFASVGGLPPAMRYGPDSSRSYFADLARRQWHTPHGEPLISLADADIASARDAYVHGHIDLAEFEQRVGEALA